ncbi:lasso peptide biosynthesis PqqD family chaperone [Litchfieldella rifensis]|uniref:Lasso peptide biosynthesis PqqD family chaperone n=1 Tax=Litchfieldella rifensis TaxID=762643 RepID=A0ABV7LW60_9GAMM
MDLANKISRVKGPLASQVNDDLVIFSARNGMYYGLPRVGNRIWSLIEHETTVSAICEKLLEEYEVDRDTCTREVVAFLDQLKHEGLIRVQ